MAMLLAVDGLCAAIIAELYMHSSGMLCHSNGYCCIWVCVLPVANFAPSCYLSPGNNNVTATQNSLIRTIANMYFTSYKYPSTS